MRRPGGGGDDVDEAELDESARWREGRAVLRLTRASNSSCAAVVGIVRGWRGVWEGRSGGGGGGAGGRVDGVLRVAVLRRRVSGDAAIDFGEGPVKD